MNAIPFPQSNQTDMIRIELVSKGLFRIVAEMPATTFQIYSEVAQESRTDVVDQIWKTGERFYSGNLVKLSRKTIKAKRSSIKAVQ